MNITRAALAIPIFAVCVFAFAAPPVYPGAKTVDELNDATKKAGQNSMAYNTFDSFEKVYEFYKSKGTEVEARHPPRHGEKFASFKFSDGYAVSISWKENSKSHGTVFFIAKAPRR
jgi:hypothetical protein